MATRNLESIAESLRVRTSGVDWHEHILTYGEPNQPMGDYAVQVALDRVFSVKGITPGHKILCWYDVLRDVGDKSHYLLLRNVHMIGVFYKLDEHGNDEVSHFFVRKLESFHGALDKWKEDIIFPSGVRKYSVCAVFPKGFVMPEQGMRDPHNQAVTQFSWERFEQLGVSLPDILDYMTYAQFAKN